jgi:type VI secretion system protein ImpJ
MQIQKPLWTKGVLLSQQHLQMQDRFYENLLSFSIDAVAFAPWGFSRLTLDHEALAAGSLGLLDAAGLFPDGLPFDVPAADVAPSPKSLDPHFTGDRTSLALYLGVPEHRPGGRNVSLSANDRGTRYLAEVVMRRDENTGLVEKPIQFGRRNLRILAEDESLEGYSLLPLTRVRKAAAGRFEVDPAFVPALLDIGASDYLLAMARRLVEVLAARSAALSGSRRQRSQGLADFGVADVANFWLLYTVNTHLPHFRHLYEVRRGHPVFLFEAMLALAGSLTTFSTTIHPRSFPSYDHGDPGPRFEKLDTVLRELLDTVVPATHAALPLHVVEACVHATAIDQDRYLTAPQLFLAVAAAMKPDELVRRAPQQLKISSHDQVQRLIRQALPGLGMRHVAQPPAALPVKGEFQYFLLDKAGAEWDAIGRARNLAVYAPLDFPDAKFELIVLLPRPG